MMTQASIRTRFHGPTNKKDQRLSVSDDAAFGEKPTRITVYWDHDSGTTENHKAAAQAWLAEFNPGHRVSHPGLSFDGDYYWTWEAI